MLRNLKIRTKMLIAFIAVAILAVGVTGFIGFTIAGNALQAESFNKLTAVREKMKLAICPEALIQCGSRSNDSFAGRMKP